MLPVKFLRILLFSCLSVFVLSSCQDENGNPTVEKPVLFVTPTISNVGAGDVFPFSVDASGINKLTKLTVEETYGGKKRIILDSNFNPPKPGVTFAYNYRVPDTSAKGQVIVLVFSLTDEKGSVTTDTETFTVSYSKPSISLQADKTTAGHGDKINFMATISSTVPNLAKLEISESINGKLPTLLDSVVFAPNTSNSIQNYGYSVPHSVTAGQYILITFKAINEEGTSASAVQRITIE